MQAVTLDPGTYVLSWWDQARDPATGNLLASTATPTAYVARVFDPSFSEVATFHDLPYVAQQAAEVGTPSLWSPRRTLTFTVAQSGTYRVAFGASTAGDGIGSVAIADVQLEVAGPSANPTAYVETSSSRMVMAFNCPRSEADLRAAFKHDCDPDGSCFYDLTTPVIIDSEALNDGSSSLSGKLAKGNYNFRHIDVAVNLVGTGVRDCSNTPTSDCYGTGYVEYTLEHDATNAGILDWNGNTRIFDFGIADIQHGKALAAERYITMPVGSADQALLAQDGIQHVEFRGRPLDGVYRLRIWDSPALKWDRLQDVQIVLNYRYWSEIVANGISQGR